MNENPYQSPLADIRAVGVLSGKQEDLRAVALYQKGILVCILVQLLAVIGQLAVPAEMRILVALVALATGLVGLVFVFLLATKVYGIGAGVILGVLTFIPCIGLIVLLIINGKATSILRQNGHKVGLLGADLSKF